MAAASVSIYVGDICLRTYGGNRSDVRSMAKRYENMSFEEFTQKHPEVSYQEFQELRVVTNFNK